MSSKIDKVFNDIDKLSKDPSSSKKEKKSELWILSHFNSISIGCKAEASEKSWEKIFSR